MGYSLKYESGKTVYLVPLHDNINDKNLMESELENFDMLTSIYNSQDEFVTKMAKLGRIEHNPTDIYLLCNRKDAKKKKLIFNNKLIKEAALDLYGQRKAGKKKEKILLKETEEMKILLDQLIEYANNPKWTKRMTVSKKTPYRIRTELSEYVKINKKIKKSPSDILELEEVKAQLLIYLRHYDILRESVLCYLDLKKEEKKHIEESNQYNLDDISIESSYSDKVKLEYLKDLKESSEELKQISEDLKNKRDAKYLEIEDPELSYWYSIGGTDAIFANVDIDKIYGASTNDKKACGIIEPKRK